MKATLGSLGLLLALGVLCVPLASAQTADEQAAMMQKMMKAATPGDVHKSMAAMAGSWNVSSKMWMDPSQDPMVSTGTSTKTMMLGDRFLKEELKADMMGMPMDGIGYTGYNNTTGKCEFMWIDSMGTMMLTGSGSMKDNTLTLMSTHVDPISGMETATRMTTEIKDENTHVFTMYGTMDGKEMKWMEATYTRAR